jgi:hypothetical protein
MQHKFRLAGVASHHRLHPERRAAWASTNVRGPGCHIIARRPASERYGRRNQRSKI